MEKRRKNMKIFIRSEILKENNKYFIQVTIIDNENNTIEHNIIYGKTKEEIINKYNKMKERRKNGANN